MKVIIPVAGAGVRLRRHTYTQPKVLLPVAGQPILGVILDRFVEAGFDDFVLVTGYLGEKIQQFVTDNYAAIKCTCIAQTERKGLGHAIWLALNEVADNEEVLILLGDTIVDTDLNALARSKGSYLAIQKVDDPREFGVAELSDEELITQLVEKPKIPKSNLALVGLYKIAETAELRKHLNACIEADLLTNDELQLTDALMCMIEAGIEFRPHKVQNWYDLGQRDILLETNATLLKLDEQSPKAKRIAENSIVIPPVSISESATIKNSVIGPYVTIGENATVEDSVVKNAIVGSNTLLENVVLEDSVIGTDALVKGMKQSLNIGDNTEIEFGK